VELVNVLEEMQMAFFSFGERDHDIAVIKVPDDQPVGSSGLAHTARRSTEVRSSCGSWQRGSGASARGWSSPRITSSPKACTFWIPTATVWRSSRRR
jgi:hypothetical protein